MKVAQLLSEYLYDQHRLHLGSLKTQIYESAEFLNKEYFNHYRLDVEQAFVLLGIIDYAGIASMVEFDDEGKSDRIPHGVLIARQPADESDSLAQIVSRISETMKKGGRIDLNLLKALLRRCRLLESDAFLPLLEADVEVFLPVFHDLAKTMRQMYGRGNKLAVQNFLKRMYASELIGLKFIRYWMDWLASHDEQLLNKSGALPFIRADGDLRHQASAAIVNNDLSWVRGFRSSLDQLGDWDRRAVISASRILGRDERGPLLANVRKRFAGHVVDRLLY